MPVDYKEKGFEAAIEAIFAEEGGYERGEPANFDAELALDQAVLIRFLQSSQPKAWERLKKVHGSEVEDRVARRIADELDQRGTLDCLRHGVKDRGIKPPPAR
jgi:type I restriction enzyme R subunit